MIYRVLLLGIFTTFSLADKKPLKHDKYLEEEIKSPPIPYNFEYNTRDENGTSQFRKESSDGAGKVQGSYGYKDSYGIERIVEYTADENGYRAQIKTNEPGTESKNPAAVQFNAQPMVVTYQNFKESKKLTDKTANTNKKHYFLSDPSDHSNIEAKTLNLPKAEQSFLFHSAETQPSPMDEQYHSAGKEQQFDVKRQENEPPKSSNVDKSHTQSVLKLPEDKKSNTYKFYSAPESSTTKEEKKQFQAKITQEQPLQYSAPQLQYVGGNTHGQLVVTPLNRFYQPYTPHHFFASVPKSEYSSQPTMNFAEKVESQAFPFNSLRNQPLMHKQGFAAPAPVVQPYHTFSSVNYS